jgi:hypothetical protein
MDRFFVPWLLSAANAPLKKSGVSEQHAPQRPKKIHTTACFTTAHVDYLYSPNISTSSNLAAAPSVLAFTTTRTITASVGVSNVMSRRA